MSFFKKKDNLGEQNKADTGEWSLIVSVASIIMTAAYVLYVTNIIYNYIPIDSWLIDFINNFVYYGPLVVCAVASVLAVSKYGFVARLVFIAIWVMIFLFSFFPDVFYRIIYGG